MEAKAHTEEDAEVIEPQQIQLQNQPIEKSKIAESTEETSVSEESKVEQDENYV